MRLLPQAQWKVHRGLTELCELCFIRTFPSQIIPGCGWWDFLPFCLAKVARKLQVQGNTSRFAAVQGFSAESGIWQYRAGLGSSQTMLHCLCTSTCCCCFDTFQTCDTQGLCHPGAAGETVLNTVILFSGSHKSTLIMFQTYQKTQTKSTKQTKPPKHT